jgi:hypothetical protein
MLIPLRRDVDDDRPRGRYLNHTRFSGRSEEPPPQSALFRAILPLGTVVPAMAVFRDSPSLFSTIQGLTVYSSGRFVGESSKSTLERVEAMTMQYHHRFVPTQGR